MKRIRIRNTGDRGKIEFLIYSPCLVWKYLAELVHCAWIRNPVRQECIKFLVPPLGGGEFMKYYGDEYQVVKRGRIYHGCGEE